MHAAIFFVAALIGAVSSLYYPTTWNEVPTALAPSCELGGQLRYLPLYVVSSRELAVLQDYRTRFYTPAPALVSFIGQKQTLPAVKVLLNTPISTPSWKTYIEFPTSFTIYQDGYRLPFQVSALFAPLPDYELAYPPAVNVVYAVPSLPGIRPAYTPPKRPQTTTVTPPPQNITVLHFPEAIAEPDVIYQGEEDDELGGRNPPIPVVPAGIVQSAAPIPDFTTFVNSKESPVLQLLRDEAKRMKNAVRT